MKRHLIKSLIAAAALVATLGIPPAFAADPATCKAVRFSDVGWTDITSTTAISSRILAGLGYAPKTDLLSVPVTYASLKSKNIDVFLGNWMPTMEADRKPDVDSGAIDIIGPNLTGAKYTLAVPTSLYDQGLSLLPTLRSSRISSRARSTASSPAMTATA